MTEVYPAAAQDGASSEEIADSCDECGTGIPYRTTCYMAPNGKTEDGLPVVSIVCVDCHD